eukprot:scaffold4301_cov115-Isochrysis_galbana.AAC.2
MGAETGKLRSPRAGREVTRGIRHARGVGHAGRDAGWGGDGVGIGGLSPRGDGAGRVVWRAKVDDVGLRHLLQVREEAVAWVARHVDNIGEIVALLLAGLPHDDGGVDVHGVHRVLDRCHYSRTEHHLQPPDVALGPVGDKHFASLDVTVVQLSRDALAELGNALLRADVRRDRTGGVADAQRDDFGVRILRKEGVAPTANLGKEVAGLQLAHIWIADHPRCRSGRNCADRNDQADGDEECGHVAASSRRELVRRRRKMPTSKKRKTSGSGAGRRRAAGGECEEARSGARERRALQCQLVFFLTYY